MSAGLVERYYTQDLHGPYETFHLGDFPLESGKTLRRASIAYSTLGQLSEKRDNAILFPSWYSGTSKILEQAYAGPGRALDPQVYFIIFVNQIGNGLSVAPSNADLENAGADFPEISIGDDVRAQHRLVTERFGLSQLQLVVGGSMGAQQTFEWAVRYPDFVKRAAPIAGTAQATKHNKLLVESFIDAIVSDEGFEGGRYKDRADVEQGLRRHARLFAVSGFTAGLFNHGLYTALGFQTVDEFVTGFVEAHFVQQDPNNLLTLLTKWKNGDVAGAGFHTLQAALGAISAKVFVIAIDEDLFFPFADLEREQSLIRDSELRRISSPWGHLALFELDPVFNDEIDRHLRDLLGVLPTEATARPRQVPVVAAH